MKKQQSKSWQIIMPKAFRTLIYRLLPAICLALIIIQLPLSAQSNQLVLQFNWPVGVVAHVEREVFKTQVFPYDSTSIHTRWSYRMETQANPEGILLRVDSVSPIVLKTSPGNWEPHYIDDFLVVSPTPLPNLIFNAKGKCIGAENIAEIKDQIDSLYRPIAEADMQGNALALSMLDQLTSERLITDYLTKDWKYIVGRWAGTSHQVGERPRVFKSTVSNPLVPTVTHTIQFTISTPEFVSCNEGDSNSSCLKLHITAAVDSTTLREMFGLLDEMTLTGQQRETLKGLEEMTISEECTIITDPHTLLPYSAEIITGYRLRLKQNPIMSPGTHAILFKSIYRFVY